MKIKKELLEKLLTALRTEGDFLRQTPNEIVIIGKTEKQEIIYLGTISKTAWYQVSDKERHMMIDRIRFGFLNEKENKL